MSRTIVITGGTSGIGLALKELFEKNGDTVFTFSIDESGTQNHYVGSVSHEIKVNQVFNDIHEKQGSIDMLINCAGFGMSAITEIAPMEKIRDVVDVNFFGTLYCTRAALRYMKPGARIVNLSSAMALFPVPFKSIYAASKSAVLSLSMAMKMELAPAGIDVVAICPGDTKTNFTKNRIKEFETTERYGDRLKTSTEHNDSKEAKRMSVNYVANQIYKLVNKKKTKPFYIVGGKYKFLYFLTRLTPKSMLINITGKKLGGRMEELPTKKTKPTPVVESEPTQTMQETAMFTELNNEEAVETNVEQTTEEILEEPQSDSQTISQEEAKNNISNILSKITILNRPGEQKAETEENTEQTEVIEEKSEPIETQIITEEPVADTSSIGESNNVVEEVKSEEVAPVVTFDEEPTKQPNPTAESTVAQTSPVSQVDSQPTTVSADPVNQPTQTTAVEEPVVSHIQFDDEF